MAANSRVDDMITAALDYAEEIRRVWQCRVAMRVNLTWPREPGDPDGTLIAYRGRFTEPDEVLAAVDVKLVYTTAAAFWASLYRALYNLDQVVAEMYWDVLETASDS